MKESADKDLAIYQNNSIIAYTSFAYTCIYQHFYYCILSNSNLILS